jgi:hypothetical protein
MINSRGTSLRNPEDRFIALPFLEADRLGIRRLFSTHNARLKPR